MNSGGQSGLESIQSFFDMKAQTDNIAYATGITSPFISFTILAMQVIGFVAIGIWMLRVSADILALAIPQAAGNKFVSKFGTKEGGDYTSAMGYIKGNLLNVIAVTILTVLLMTGYLYRILSLFLGGVGTVLNVVFGLDIDGVISASDASAYVNQLGTRQATDLRNEYDSQLESVKQFANQLYQYSAEGISNKDSTWKSASRKYTTAYIKAESIAKQVTKNNQATQELKLGNSYFAQHKENSKVCNTKFGDADVQSAWKVAGVNTNISCSK